MRPTNRIASIACPLAAALLAGGPAMAGPTGSANVAMVLQPPSLPACWDLISAAERPLKVSWGDHGAVIGNESPIAHMKANRTRTRDPNILAAYEGSTKYHDRELTFELVVLGAQVQMKIAAAQPACLWLGTASYK